ncbi:Regulator of competence-specific genes [Anaerohalosphaera lusitana]|uniref:Regulator of competence-specific genes n=1 Tax=Anaerohalosphaera lusitana TaxID=1936003 RepID=A0A1U9NGF0_9BACT|nr:TfoX/Sxy family protein [Anaerohalosphaera lusitana]AQT67019.1 Regulator of competence-specific genes [Anaerohalosphaera lusitana]
MTVSDEYLEYVLDQLRFVDDVTYRKMFGAIGIYSGPDFFAIIDEDVLYFKVDDHNRPDYESAGTDAFRPYEDPDMTMSYYEVPVDVLESADTLAVWAQKAIAAARRKKTRKR